MTAVGAASRQGVQPSASPTQSERFVVTVSLVCVRHANMRERFVDVWIGYGLLWIVLVYALWQTVLEPASIRKEHTIHRKRGGPLPRRRRRIIPSRAGLLPKCCQKQPKNPSPRPTHPKRTERTPEGRTTDRTLRSASRLRSCRSVRSGSSSLHQVLLSLRRCRGGLERNHDLVLDFRHAGS